jgi:hypothetical protein
MKKNRPQNVSQHFLGCIIWLATEEETMVYCLSYVKAQNGRYQNSLNLGLIHEMLLHDLKVGTWQALRSRSLVKTFNTIV